VVIDTPGADTYLTRLAHSIADTLIIPLNDSFLDFDVLAAVDPQTFAVVGTSHYLEMVREARRQRRLVDGKVIDWVVVRNRLSMLGSRNRRLIDAGAHELAGRRGFRFVDGFTERAVYRELFPRGLSALDDLDAQTLGTPPSMAHVTARREVEVPLASLKLPIDERGRQRAEARAQWLAIAGTPLEMHDILAE
jgi:chromosome partitioning protein